MGENRSLMTILGALLGFVLLIVVIIFAVDYFREGTDEFRERQRQAGVPILLSETLSEGEEAAADAEISATAATTETVALADAGAVTETVALTETSGITETSDVTATTNVTATAAVTDAVAAVTTAVTTTDSLTETATVTDSTAVAEVVEPTAVPEPTAAPASAPVAQGGASAEAAAPIFAKAGCVACHVIPEVPGAVGMVGPDLTEIGVIAATRVEGLSAEEYLYQSILEPNAFIAPECPTGPCLPGLMIQNIGDILTLEEIDTVVGYLATLGVQ